MVKYLGGIVMIFCVYVCGGAVGGVSKKRNPPIFESKLFVAFDKNKKMYRGGAPLRKERMVVVFENHKGKTKNRVRLLMRKSSHEKKEFPPRGVKKKERQKKKDRNQSIAR